MNAASPDSPAGTGPAALDLPFPIRVARVRHDLNNPITHIVGFGEMLLEEVQAPGREPLRDDLELVNRTAGQMLTHINDCLDPAKIEAGFANLPRLQELLRADAAQILAAVERLTRDSRGFADTFGSDLARVAGAAQRVSELADSAIPTLAPIPGTETSHTERTARTLAALLRLEAETQPALPTPKEGDILVVDDLEANRELLSRRLSRLGYSVQLTDSGARALEIVAAQPVDLILLDILMPGLDGFGVLKRLKSDPATKHIPVLMLSSADETDTVVRCIQLGAEDFLPKPFNPTLLMARIESSLAKKRLHDQERHFLQQLQAERDTSERLLLNILPQPVAQRLKQGEAVIADGFPEVTVLFSDFAGFTKFSSATTPKELVGRLNEIFSAFDRLCEQHGLEKIKMIGDAYMVAGGVPVPRTDHAEAVAELALAMQAEVARFGAGHRQPFQMRVGINSGPVVAGVIGRKKFAYDLWGDTVNLASRMESHAPTGGILVTAATYERLKEKFRFEPGRVVRVRGRGRVLTYSLVRKSDGPTSPA